MFVEVFSVRVVKDFKDLKDFVFRFRLLRRNRTKKTAFFARISPFFVRQNYKLFAVEPKKTAIIFLLKN